MTHKKTGVIVSCGLAAVLGIAALWAAQNTAFFSHKVMRCAVSVIEKDPATGKNTGFSYDLVTEIARRMHYKIDWQENVPLKNMAQDLADNKYDAVCVPFLKTTERQKDVTFSASVARLPFFLYVRKDEDRTDASLRGGDPSKLKLSLAPHDYSDVGQKEAFPRAKRVEIVDNPDVDAIYKAVAEKKADAIVTTSGAFNDYQKAHADVLKQSGENAVLDLEAGFPLNPKFDAPRLNAAIAALVADGTLDRLMKKYEAEQGGMLPAPKPEPLPTTSGTPAK